MHGSISRVAASATTMAATAAALLAVAAPVHAEVTGVHVAAGPDGLLTGCQYTVTADVTDSDVPTGTVFFMLAGGVIPGNGERIPGEAVFHPDTKTVTATWTPTRQGQQNLIAIQSIPGQYTSSQYISIEVSGAGINTGSSCLRIG
ncbi:hypothetical protein [Nocardia pseudobrasiliensis]|uniref:Ig-like domain-containing protein n=1 Tax=Nocardia pseudobrasiliensis TaxID=45979 RepID=A0A370IEE0_9NOCA|nr:hypothetical protein [Nocardia pseudobrasiliensis]RDI68940.1 hypothetical protein DFR76_101476 [Nocardia pseudobrasiliensis]